ncbi:MAG: 23S rRNA (adenine(2503)-C(2))-methyltransferase RlmN [Spirochaetes bacterium]|nr:23S rRNA (adenine(2503)-C(2))-methyltransferase RlmN [Spirochaetota bacterium]
MEQLEKPDIRDLLLHDLELWLEYHKEPSYRAGQIWRWLYQKGEDNFRNFSDLSFSLRNQLSRDYVIKPLGLEAREISRDGTEKFLFRLHDNNCIETVFIPFSRHNTVCLSSQVGCRFGCRFCASGLLGLKRNLRASEILAQLLTIKFGEKKTVHNLVFMGIGEPLDNINELKKALDVINSRNGVNMGARKITVSTVGIPQGIRDLAQTGKQFELSLSLHAPSDELRQKIIPISGKYPLKEILDALSFYQKKTKRKVTFEYILLKDLNDSTVQAEQLARLLKGLVAGVNLIPFNSCPEFSYEPPSRQKILQFQQILERKGVNVTLRKARGQDIAGACGQLRIKISATP